jgi:hypothetical protein
MITADCPWCDGSAMVEMMADEAELRCDECEVAIVIGDLELGVAARAA